MNTLPSGQKTIRLQLAGCDGATVRLLVRPRSDSTNALISKSSIVAGGIAEFTDLPDNSRLDGKVFELQLFIEKKFQTTIYSGVFGKEQAVPTNLEFDSGLKKFYEIVEKEVPMPTPAPPPPIVVTGEKGDKGDRGDKGDKGDKGDRGDKGDTTYLTPPAYRMTLHRNAETLLVDYADIFPQA